MRRILLGSDDGQAPSSGDKTALDVASPRSMAKSSCGTLAFRIHVHTERGQATQCSERLACPLGENTFLFIVKAPSEHEMTDMHTPYHQPTLVSGAPLSFHN